MQNNDDFLGQNQSFINFLLDDNLGNMTNFSWNASSTTKFSHKSLNSLPYVHIDIKTYSIESMVMLLNNLYKLEQEEIPQEYKGPTGINLKILESYSLKANKLQKFLQSKKQLHPFTFFTHYKLIDEFLSFCAIYLDKSKTNIQDLDLYDEKLFHRIVSDKKLSISKIKQFEKIYKLYFYKAKFSTTLKKKKKIEEFNHVAIEHHLNDIRKECTKETINRRKHDYKNFLDWLNTVYVEFQSYSLNFIPLFLVTTNHLEEYKVFLISQFQDGIYSKHTVSDIFYNVRSLFEYLYQTKSIANDITSNVNSIKFEKYKYREIPTNRQLSEFFDAVMCYTPFPFKYCTAYKLMLNLGLRLSEVANLETSNINFGTNTISIKGKDGKYNILPLPESLSDDLYSLVKSDKKYVFSDKPRLFKVNLYQYYKLISFILNWDFPGGVHLFRHTFITRLSEQPNQLPQVIQYLGRHARPDTTSLYIHRNNKSLNNAINKINYF